MELMWREVVHRRNPLRAMPRFGMTHEQVEDLKYRIEFWDSVRDNLSTTLSKVAFGHPAKAPADDELETIIEAALDFLEGDIG